MHIISERANGLSRMTFVLLALLGCMAAGAATERRSFDIPEGALVESLHSFSLQSQLQLLFDAEAIDDVTARAVRGDFEDDEALSTMLGGTAVVFQFVNKRTVVIARRQAEATTATSKALAVAASADQAVATGTRVPQGVTANREQDQQTADGPDASSDSRRSMPEVLIRGSSINADIRRSEDDIQPYVVFDREEIERSQAPDLEAFFKSKLPMNTSNFTLEQRAYSPSASSGSINLRGLGSKQTLVLVDGRRIPGVATRSDGDIQQPNISGIPLSSVERIEILPSTASAIYGGGATGGVINIVRKRDYRGIEIAAQYAGDFAGDSSSTQVYANGGMRLRDGATSLSFSASHSESNPLLVVEREFGQKSRALALANGASADGFEPVLGNTPNICSALQFEPGQGVCNAALVEFGFPDVPLVLDDGTPVGSSITSVPKGYAGPSGDGGRALIDNAGTYDLGIPSDGQYLLRTPVSSSASASLRHAFGATVDAFIDLSSNRSESDSSTGEGVQGLSAVLSADDPANPFLQDILVSRVVPDFHNTVTSKSESFQGTAGIVWRLPMQWALSIEYSRGRSKYVFSYPEAPLVSPEGVELLGSTVLKDLTAHPVDLGPYRIAPTNFFVSGPFESTQGATTLRVSGPTLSLPGGPIGVSALIEQRKEVAEDAFSDRFGQSTWYPERTQRISSYYLETTLPVLAPDQNRRFAREFEIQAAIRRDEYEANSTATNLGLTAPTRDGPFSEPAYFRNETSATGYLLGARYSPAADLAFRASFATGFLPPSLSQITPLVIPVTNSGGALSPPDPKRGDTTLSIPRVEITSGNQAIRSEDSETVSAGFILTPSRMPGLRLSLDYSRIQKRDEIFGPSTSFILANEDSFPGRVIRGPNLPTDPIEWAGPVTQIDSSLLNISDALIEALDLQLDYALELSRLGTVHLSAVGTSMSSLERQVTPESEVYDSVGYSDGPLRRKWQAGVSWQKGPWGATWSTQYFGSYSVRFASPNSQSVNESRITRQGSDRISSQIYHDLFLRYRPSGSENGFMSGLEVSVGIQNVLNRSPPILAVDGLGGYASETYSLYGDPRLRSFSLMVKKAFWN